MPIFVGIESLLLLVVVVLIGATEWGTVEEGAQLGVSLQHHTAQIVTHLQLAYASQFHKDAFTAAISYDLLESLTKTNEGYQGHLLKYFRLYRDAKSESPTSIFPEVERRCEDVLHSGGCLP